MSISQVGLHVHAPQKSSKEEQIPELCLKDPAVQGNYKDDLAVTAYSN